MISLVLVKEKGQQKLPVYYRSKALQGVEARYSDMEKLTLALVTTLRKL